jgi:hypothetical protein
MYPLPNYPPSYPYPNYPSTGGGYYGGGNGSSGGSIGGGVATMPMPAEPSQPTVPSTPSVGNTYQLNNYRSTAPTLAGLLNQIGLLYGTGTGNAGRIDYALDSPLTRIEALAIVVRLMGLEEKANAYTGLNPFTDTPAWGDRIAAYAYQQGITVGINNAHTLFAPDRNVTYQEFTAFLLRVLGYFEKSGDFAYEQALDKAIDVTLFALRERQLISSASEYLRADAVIGMVDALLTKTKASDKRLIDKLISDGVIRQEAANSFISSVTAVYTRS